MVGSAFFNGPARRPLSSYKLEVDLVSKLPEGADFGREPFETPTASFSMPPHWPGKE